MADKEDSSGSSQPSTVGSSGKKRRKFREVQERVGSTSHFSLLCLKEPLLFAVFATAKTKEKDPAKRGS